MKTSKLTMWMLLALMGVVAMVSCSSDDDFDGNRSEEGIDMSDDGEVLSGEEITREVADLLAGTWKTTFSESPGGTIFLYKNYSKNADDVKFVFTENGRIVLFVDGKQNEDPNRWFKDDSYTLGTDWTINYVDGLDDKGEPCKYKSFEGYIYMNTPLSDKSSFGAAYVVNIRENGDRVTIIDAIAHEHLGEWDFFQSPYSDLTKVADSDRVVVE